jgi:hypothetical protein
VKSAQLSVLGTILVQEREFGLVEFAEKLIPLDRFEPIFLGAEIDPENSSVPILFGCAHRGRMSVALLRPFPDRFVVRGRFALAHVAAPFLSAMVDWLMANHPSCMKRSGSPIVLMKLHDLHTENDISRPASSSSSTSDFVPGWKGADLNQVKFFYLFR